MRPVAGRDQLAARRPYRTRKATRPKLVEILNGGGTNTGAANAGSGNFGLFDSGNFNAGSFNSGDSKASIGNSGYINSGFSMRVISTPA